MKVFMPFLRGNSPKANVQVRREFELAYYDVAVNHVDHNAMGDILYPEKIFYNKIILIWNRLDKVLKFE